MKLFCFCLLLIFMASGGKLIAQLNEDLLEKLSPQVNTEYEEISPVVSSDGQTLYFTRSGAPSFQKSIYSNGENLYASLSYREYKELLRDIYSQLAGHTVYDPVRSDFNQDIWIANSINGSFDQVYQPEYPLNNALPNSVCATTGNPGEVVIINHFYKNGSMYKGFSLSNNVSGEWTFPEPLFVYDFENMDAGVNMALSKSAEVMILSMKRQDSSGENDLYMSYRIHQKLWSSPVSLGPDINTEYKEMSPYLSGDERYLFFSSNRPGGMGGNDIYVSRRMGKDWTRWSEPQLLAEPINSGFDDAQPYFSKEFLYFTSNRDGSSDIFRIPFRAPTTTTEKKPPDNFITLNVVESSTGKPVSAKLLYGKIVAPHYTDSVAIGQKGGSLRVSHSSVIKIKPVKKGYISREYVIDPLEVDSKGKGGQGVYTMYVDPIAENVSINLDPIYFERSHDRILEKSYSTLDELVEILKKHHEIHIRIEGHTDNVGDQEALYSLSERRALAVKRYLMRTGIEVERIKTQGYGASMPITDNLSEAQKAQNRRVEFVIIKV